MCCLSYRSGRGNTPPEDLEKPFQAEKEATEKAREDVISFLSHDTSFTRRRLVEALRQRIEVIEAKMGIYKFDTQKRI